MARVPRLDEYSVLQYVPMIELTDQPIDAAAVLSSVASPEAGAVVLFVGTTRSVTDGRRTESLDYDAYRPMAEKKLAELERDARERWNLVGCSLIHRLGHLEVGESSVAVAVSSPHRAAAFDAARWLIDTIKRSVPIWKKENWADGTSHWVHPGVMLPQEVEKRP